MEREPILFYGGKWGCFSNMSSYAVELDGKVFMTSEHAYQYSKFTDEEVKNKIFNARSGHDAKMIALVNKSLTMPNWTEQSLEVMEKILRAKLAQHPHIREKLLETGDNEIIEASPTDAFWGWGSDKKGENHHGKIWMKLRSEIR